MEGFHVSGCVHMIKRAGGKGKGTFPLQAKVVYYGVRSTSTR